MRLVLPTGLVLARKADGIGWITLNNPAKRNAITMAMWEAMAAACADFMADGSVRVAVLSGAGGAAFAAGADIGEMERMREAGRAEEYAARNAASRAVMDRFEKPLIAMIGGHCIGGGLALALRADLRVASEDSVFGIPAAKLGIAYAMENMQRLVAAVGATHAREMMFTGATIDAATAAARGLINRAVPPERLEPEVAALAARIAANAPLSIRASKLALDTIAGDPRARDDARHAEAARACAASEDLAEGQRAFREKRRPVFRGV